MDGYDSSIREVRGVLKLETLVFLSTPSVPKNETEGKLFCNDNSLWTNHRSVGILGIQNICKDDS